MTALSGPGYVEDARTIARLRDAFLLPVPLTVATTQFPVSADLDRNAEYVLRQMETAAERGADVVHVPEAGLSGYAGTDLDTHATTDWARLRRHAKAVMARADTLGCWVILGSAHPLSGDHKPHNSCYVIDDAGRLVDRYDKRFCAGNAAETTGDLAHYTPGDHFSVFTIGDVRCGILICHDYRYPELYREYKQRGVQLLFHAFHAGNNGPERWQKMRAQVGEAHWRHNPRTTLPGITMPATTRAAAANSYLWISCSNSSAPESCWPAFFVRPDGVATGRLTRNEAGVLISTVDPSADWYDATAAWRDRAMAGTYHSGTLVEDKRSEARTEL